MRTVHVGGRAAANRLSLHWNATSFSATQRRRHPALGKEQGQFLENKADAFAPRRQAFLMCLNCEVCITLRGLVFWL